MGPNPVPLVRLPILLSSTASGLASEETGTSFSVDEVTKSPAAGWVPSAVATSLKDGVDTADDELFVSFNLYKKYHQRNLV